MIEVMLAKTILVQTPELTIATTVLVQINDVPNPRLVYGLKLFYSIID